MMKVDLHRQTGNPNLYLKLVAESDQDRLTLEQWIKDQSVTHESKPDNWYDGRVVGTTRFCAVTMPILKPGTYYVDTHQTPIGPDTLFVGMVSEKK